MDTSTTEQQDTTSAETPSRLVYVDCTTDLTRPVTATIAQILGMYPAQQRVEHWFNNYTELLYDSETAEVVMVKRRTSGDWEVNRVLILAFK